jgi:transposase-like protein
LRDEIISTQRLIIEEQRELIKIYKYILKSKKIFRNNRYSAKEKADIISKVESSSKSLRASLRELCISRGTFHYWKEQLKSRGDIQNLSEIKKYKYE